MEIVKESILFWPVRLDAGTLYILDETRIPQEVVYLEARDYTQAIAAIVDMKTRAFGQFLTVCYTFMLEADKLQGRSSQEVLTRFSFLARAFNTSRPTFPFEEVTGMILGFAAKLSTSPSFVEDFKAFMENFLEKGIRKQRYGRSQEAASLLKDGDGVLTHCHVSGEMGLIAEFCRQAGKKVRFFATETRPYFQGARLTAWELNELGFDVTLIPDNATAKLMSEGRINCVIVGSDRSAKNGDFANKIGTYQIALLARHFDLPFYVLAQPSAKLASGDQIPIELRDERELLYFEGERLAPEGARAYYPGFDVVSCGLVTQHIAIHAN